MRWSDPDIAKVRASAVTNNNPFGFLQLRCVMSGAARQLVTFLCSSKGIVTKGNRAGLGGRSRGGQARRVAAVKRLLSATTHHSNRATHKPLAATRPGVPPLSWCPCAARRTGRLCNSRTLLGYGRYQAGAVGGMANVHVAHTVLGESPRFVCDCSASPQGEKSEPRWDASVEVTKNVGVAFNVRAQRRR